MRNRDIAWCLRRETPTARTGAEYLWALVGRAATRRGEGQTNAAGAPDGWIGDQGAIYRRLWAIAGLSVERRAGGLSHAAAPFDCLTSR